MRTDGTGRRALTDNPGDDDLSPTFSPNGKRIAFSSDRAGSLEIYTINTAGKRLERLTYAPGDDDGPTW
jgi:TolB protein